jgi:hypothetical protein
VVNRPVTFPFVPRSTSHLEPGCFWPIRLSDGRYSAATVLVGGAGAGDTPAGHGTRVFIAGLLSWTGAQPPTSQSLAQADLVDWGAMHVRAIPRHGEHILDRWDGVDTLSPILKVSHRAGGSVGLFTNGRAAGRATPEQARSLPVMGTWGLDFLWNIAERVHVREQPAAI